MVHNKVTREQSGNFLVSQPTKYIFSRTIFLYIWSFWKCVRFNVWNLVNIKFWMPSSQLVTRNC